MKNSEELKKILHQIDGRGYKAYKRLEGAYEFGDFIFFIDHTQVDPFAPPSRARVRVGQTAALFPPDTFKNKSREIALRDFITRRFYQNIIKYGKEGSRGTGKSGRIGIATPRQEILERSSVIVNDEYIEARINIGLPAFGRRISSREAEQIFFSEFPPIVAHSLFFKNLDKELLYKHIYTAEDADFLRGKLDELGIVSFIADGSVLPRRSGIDMRPLIDENVIPFSSPVSLNIEISLPNTGNIKGLGIKKGVTVIVGGGYHGKSTLLNAIELGVYNHIPGDGREFVVTDASAFKIRAEDGRSIKNVNISAFINNLPFGQSTQDFSTDNASGSTSQAANIIESVEAGAKVLLLDEDTSATNFMIRDHKMQKLVAKEYEPITPFIDKVGQLFKDLEVSTILVMGGSGDYLSVADAIIGMVDYKPYDFTERAKEIAEKYKTERQMEGGEHFGEITPRTPVSASIDASNGRKSLRIKAIGMNSLMFGSEIIDLFNLEQIVDGGQLRAIGYALAYSKRYMTGKRMGRTIKQVTELLMSDIYEKGLDLLQPFTSNGLCAFRAVDFEAVINRMRSLKMET